MVFLDWGPILGDSEGLMMRGLKVHHRWVVFLSPAAGMFVHGTENRFIPFLNSTLELYPKSGRSQLPAPAAVFLTRR